ncbi:uncharacterized protein PHACADRAFT_199972 [Phanerochaete carnosa HHB-10118-sp]|uniref:PPIase cyclophilin-type domain-containing protein n=1 Tax=Phanerochaete carnosa (strain HHB-10118-sp) TaxID=650164 RepID=K5VIM8_PHACS|nr:uncharacterized protein PHACADRAFT_199972 [Phanerochaete carnosa HHB-10118-sp]EKM51138.1 hypothetical protein PHACADRAFT_199972 [Phanerochaete carnosa HHB-10118-sp]
MIMNRHDIELVERRRSRVTRADSAFSQLPGSCISNMSTSRSLTYFDITIGGQPAGCIVFQLYDDTVLKTAENRQARGGNSEIAYKGQVERRD